jgi:hypothetical protein
VDPPDAVVLLYELGIATVLDTEAIFVRFDPVKVGITELTVAPVHDDSFPD